MIKALLNEKWFLALLAALVVAAVLLLVWT